MKSKLDNSMAAPGTPGFLGDWDRTPLPKINQSLETSFLGSSSFVDVLHTFGALPCERNFAE
jgi:hypothetical protein